MQIHHSQRKKAEKIGVQLEESGAMVRAVWPMRNIAVYGVDVRWAIEQMEAAQRLVKEAEERGLSISLRPSVASPVMVHLKFDDDEWTSDAKAPAVWWNEKDMTFPSNAETIEQEAQKLGTEALHQGFNEWDNPKPAEFTEDKPRTVNKVPTNGAVAYRQGRTASECPFEEGTAEFDAWNQQFDDEADKPADEGEPEEPQPHSVVKSKYRAIYAEAGHPTTCGDGLATRLNSLLKNAGGTNIELLDEICKLNEVDISKYNRTSNGWQGRLRMTARNMLAKKVRDNGGMLNLPEMLGGSVKIVD